MIREFIEKYTPYALESERKTGISYLFILAQAALESGWGMHAPLYNFFGVKATKNTPMECKQLLVTKEITLKQQLKLPQIVTVKQLPDGWYHYIVKDWFMCYKSPEEAFTAHARLLSENKRYAKAMLYKSDAYKFADEVAKAGYATAPHYAERLKMVIKTIEKHLKTHKNE